MFESCRVHLIYFNLRKRLSGIGKVRRDFAVFGSEKYQPPPFRQIKVLCTVTVCFSKSISFHCKAKYSFGRIPLAKAKAKIKPCLSFFAASKNLLACELSTNYIKSLDEIRLERSTAYLKEEHINKIANAYRNFEDIEGFAKVVGKTEVLRETGGNLSVQLYVKSSKKRARTRFARFIKRCRKAK